MLRRIKRAALLNKLLLLLLQLRRWQIRTYTWYWWWWWIINAEFLRWLYMRVQVLVPDIRCWITANEEFYSNATVQQTRKLQTINTLGMRDKQYSTVQDPTVSVDGQPGFKVLHTCVYSEFRNNVTYFHENSDKISKKVCK